MGIRDKLAKLISSTVKTEAEIQSLVKDEVRRAVAALPLAANYDPQNEGYRRLSGDSQARRDLSFVAQDRMFEIAYYMYDASAMLKGLVDMDRGFLFGEPITVTSDNDQVDEVIQRFWEDSYNNFEADLPDLMSWLSILGEQCYPATVNQHNGHVWLAYEDPASIKEVYVLRDNVKVPVQVEMQGTATRSGKKYAVIREDRNPRSKTYGRLVGDCFFFAINHPPNSPRGRSDYLTLFDWIDGLERYGYNYLERAELMLNFVWDVMLKGFTEEQIRAWLQQNRPPDPGSLRAHNEHVEWKAVSPDIKAHDHVKGYEMGKAFIMGAARRPASWFGEGGKAYQTEAEQFGQVPLKDLDQRQGKIKQIVTLMVRFQIDQAVIHERLSPDDAAAGFQVNVPEISKKDLAKLVNGVPQLATALAVAETNKWISRETATRLFAFVVGQLGMEIDVEAELAAARKNIQAGRDLVTDDYE